MLLKAAGIFRRLFFVVLFAEIQKFSLSNSTQRPQNKKNAKIAKNLQVALCVRILRALREIYFRLTSKLFRAPILNFTYILSLFNRSNEFKVLLLH